MHRFYISHPIDGDTFTLTGEQLHHIRDVLRLKAGDRVALFDSSRNEYLSSIQKIDKTQALLKVDSMHTVPPPRTRITIACAVPKKSGMDDLIDALTQLGVDVIIPMQTERVIVKPDESRQDARLERWRRIALSAAQQSQRSSIPEIHPVTALPEVIAESSGCDLKLIPALTGERRSLREVLDGKEPHRIIVLIGPEGDFTPEEVALAVGAGFISVTLGDNILRVATAALAAASYICLALPR